MLRPPPRVSLFFFNDPAPPEISPLPLPDALPICGRPNSRLMRGSSRASRAASTSQSRPGMGRLLAAAPTSARRCSNLRALSAACATSWRGGGGGGVLSDVRKIMRASEDGADVDQENAPAGGCGWRAGWSACALAAHQTVDEEDDDGAHDGGDPAGGLPGLVPAHGDTNVAGKKRSCHAEQDGHDPAKAVIAGFECPRQQANDQANDEGTNQGHHAFLRTEASMPRL